MFIFLLTCVSVCAVSVYMFLYLFNELVIMQINTVSCVSILKK